MTTFETYLNMLKTYENKHNSNTGTKAVYEYLYNIVFDGSRLPF